jgi:hypothetical protein
LPALDLVVRRPRWFTHGECSGLEFFRTEWSNRVRNAADPDSLCS